MSYIKEHLVGLEERRDYLAAEVIDRYHIVEPMWGIDTGKVLYDAVAPLIDKMLRAQYELAEYQGVKFDAYFAAYHFLGQEIMDLIANEYLRRNPEVTEKNADAGYFN